MRYLLVGFLFLLFSCQTTSFEEGNPTDIEELKRIYAKGFKVEYGRGYKKFTVHIAPGDSAIFYLQQGDNPPPTAAYPIIKSPVLRAITYSTTVIPFLDRLNKLDVLSGVAYLNFVRNEKIQQRAKEGKVRSLSGLAADIENLLLCDASLVFVHSRSEVSEEQWGKFGITPIYFTEFSENHPLAKAEWIKFFGALFDKEEDADSIFQEIEAAYLEEKSKIPTSMGRQKVLFGYEYQGRWSSPGGKSNIAKLIEDAGGTFFNENSTSNTSVYMDMEEVIVRSSDVRVWLMIGQYQDSPTIPSLMADSPFYKTLLNSSQVKLFLCNTLKNNYFEDAVLEPHILLQDFAAAFYPTAYARYKPTYFKKV